MTATVLLLALKSGHRAKCTAAERAKLLALAVLAAQAHAEGSQTRNMLIGQMRSVCRRAVARQVA